ncbi:NAD(+) synthase [Clostridium sp. Marseille-P2415]|uniref:NAD(+) synthase n=1 Tax=Clostridium sp. Marseille-P2415 TaxID=1805471 RepID=UPI0009885030|nr:NAD(+) synthase [Clostridium sp. Marseille-P2415]
MKHGYIRVAAATPDVKVADPEFNRKRICELIKDGIEKNAKIMVFPELCLTSYTCGDLFGQDALLRKAKEELKEILKATKGHDLLAFVGMPWERSGKLYNTAAAVQNGKILGIVPKTNLPNYSEFYELRYFEPGNELPVMVKWEDELVPMGTNILFACEDDPKLVVAAEICEDAWVPNPPSIRHATAGATVIVNCSASDETTGKDIYRRSLIIGHSASLVCGYIYANAGEGESSQDLVFGGQNLISEDGTLLTESKRFENETIYGDMDLERLNHERRRMTTFPPVNTDKHAVVTFRMKQADLELKRFIDPRPFVPDNEKERNRRCEEILSIQAMGLKKRLAHTGCKHVVVGISGGLDSTLALLVTVRAFDMLGIPRGQIHAVTMPCFGTTDRTYQNACLLTGKLGVQLTEVNIEEAVRIHFRDIGQSADVHDVTYENSQARERTQILMDMANRLNGLVVGTGDMSELALGWATYNGDHMSMYGVNASVPKTLVRHLVRYYADTCGDEALRDVLLDILDTPVSPELLPPQDGKIAQKTEDLVGPYELHDFFLYQILRFGYRPQKVYRMASYAFEGRYEKEAILKWLKVFYRRFFSQQFKRSCMPDGPKVGSVAVSPRGDLRMPSDAVSRLWLEELENL